MMSRSHSSPIHELVQLNADDLLRYFQRRLTNRDDAADAYGDLLLTAWRLRRKAPDDSTEARMWLFAIAHNILRTSRRTTSRRSAALERFADDLRAMPTHTDEASALEVRDALTRLPEEDAELIRLTYWDGLTSHEAAAVLGINPSTARSRLARARLHLRSTLHHGEAEDEHHAHNAYARPPA